MWAQNKSEVSGFLSTLTKFSPTSLTFFSFSQCPFPSPSINSGGWVWECDLCGSCTLKHFHSSKTNQHFLQNAAVLKHAGENFSYSSLTASCTETYRSHSLICSSCRADKRSEFITEQRQEHTRLNRCLHSSSTVCKVNKSLLNLARAIFLQFEHMRESIDYILTNMHF